MASYQSNRASCGPASLHNALEALGVHRTEEELIKLCGQTANGTSARGIIQACGKIGEGISAKAFKRRDGDEAAIGLWYFVSERGRPAILCVDQFEHWVAVVGVVGSRFVILDSAETGLVFYYTAPDLLKRWEGPNGGYHAIVL